MLQEHVSQDVGVQLLLGAQDNCYNTYLMIERFNPQERIFSKALTLYFIALSALDGGKVAWERFLKYHDKMIGQLKVPEVLAAAGLSIFENSDARILFSDEGKRLFKKPHELIDVLARNNNGINIVELVEIIDMFRSLNVDLELIKGCIDRNEAIEEISSVDNIFRGNTFYMMQHQVRSSLRMFESGVKGRLSIQGYSVKDAHSRITVEESDEIFDLLEGESRGPDRLMIKRDRKKSKRGVGKELVGVVELRPLQEIFFEGKKPYENNTVLVTRLVNKYPEDTDPVIEGFFAALDFAKEKKAREVMFPIKDTSDPIVLLAKVFAPNFKPTDTASGKYLIIDV